MRQKIFTLFLFIFANFGILNAEIVTGSCGENVTFTYDSETKTFTVSGSGPMTDYTKSQWLGVDLFNRNYNYTDVLTIVIEDGITRIGNYAFWKFSSATSVSIANSVECIGNNAFANCTSLLEVVLPKSITTIEHNAFTSCLSMKNIHLPDNLTTMEYQVFMYCDALTSITIPENLQFCGQRIFENCANLKTVYWNAINCQVKEDWISILRNSHVSEVVLGPNVQTIPDAFAEMCSELVKINLPEGLKTIGDYAFHGASLTGDLTIPSSVESVGRNAFEDCDLYTLHIKGIITNYKDVFTNNKNLTKVTLSGNINTTFSYWYNTNGASPIFAGCEKLKEVKIEDGVKYIGDGAFWKCPISEIKLPESLEIIGALAFSETNITEITIPKNVREIRRGAFDGCANLTLINYYAQSATMGNPYRFSSNDYDVQILNGAFHQIGNNVELIIGKDVVSIPDYIFGDGYYRKENNTEYSKGGTSTNPSFIVVTFEDGSKCTHVGAFAFHGLKNVKSFTCPATDCHLEEGNGIYNFSTDLQSVVAPASFFNFSEEHWAETSKSLKSVQITGGELTSDGFSVIKRSANVMEYLDLQNISNLELSDNALNGCYQLKTLSFPQNLNKIGYMALAGCSNLTILSLPATLSEIGMSAFVDCIGLTSIAIPSNVTYIGNYAFKDCIGLTSVTCSAITPPTMGNKVFYGIDCSNIPLYVPAASIATYKTTDQWKDFYNIQAIDGTEFICDVQTTEPSYEKRIRNGQVLILRGDKTYTLQGQVVK